MAEPADKGEAGGGGVPRLGRLPPPHPTSPPSPLLGCLLPPKPGSLQRGLQRPGPGQGRPRQLRRACSLPASHPTSAARPPIPPFQFDSIRPPRSEACLL